MKEEIKSLWTVNGKPIKWIIGQYVDRNDVRGLAEFFMAHLDDVSEILHEPKRD